MSNNPVVYQARLHIILFFWPVVLACVAIFVWLEFDMFREVAMLFFAVAVIWSIMTWVIYQFSSITIKKKQVILRTGIIVRNTIDIPLGKIETIDIRQPLIGSLLGYGTLIITGTGGTKHFINYLAYPLTCRRYIEQLMHE